MVKYCIFGREFSDKKNIFRQPKIYAKTCTCLFMIHQGAASISDFTSYRITSVTCYFCGASFVLVQWNIEYRNNGKRLFLMKRNYEEDCITALYCNWIRGTQGVWASQSMATEMQLHRCNYYHNYERLCTGEW